MSINPSIALGVRPMQIEGPIDNYAKMLTLKDLMQRSQAGEIQMQDAQRARDDEMATRNAYMQSGGDGNKLRALLLGAGNYKAANAYDSQEMARKKAQGEAEKAQLEGVMQKLSMGAQLLGGVRDQASYDSARATAHANGLDVSRMPAQYDPAFIQQKMQEGQTVKEQLEQKWKAMEYTTPNANTRLQSQTSLTTNALTNATSRANNAASVGATIRGQNMVDSRTRESTAASMSKPFEVTGPDGTPLLVQQDKQGNIAPVKGYTPKGQSQSMKPMPTAALKMQQTSLDVINTASNTQADLGAIERQIQNGKLDFGLVSNLVNKGRNAIGMSSEESRNLSSFKSSLEKLRNDSLRLNAGVQTDGDAQRAWNELFENINDKGVVQQRLGEIKKLNARAVVQHKLNIDGIRTNYGQGPLDTSGYENQGAAVGDIHSQADAILKGK